MRIKELGFAVTDVIEPAQAPAGHPAQAPAGHPAQAQAGRAAHVAAS
jgi:hypothetical protein